MTLFERADRSCRNIREKRNGVKDNVGIYSAQVRGLISVLEVELTDIKKQLARVAEKTPANKRKRKQVKSKRKRTASAVR